MNSAQPRMLMLAGPNGSGKSIIKRKLPPDWLGVDINPDDIEAAIRSSGQVSLDAYRVAAERADLVTFFGASELLKRAGLHNDIEDIAVVGNCIEFGDISVNSYWASATAAFLRKLLMQQRESFTFETVMSSPDKLDTLREASSRGYRTYLYYVATDDPEINISRVAIRVAEGGHDVPKDKIVSRYGRSLQHLLTAIRLSSRAFLWDNSGSELLLLAVAEHGELEIKCDAVPQWFDNAVLRGLDADLS